ncbi:MAG TPA: LysR family transcriptional regulator [Rhizomicrobium sp.]|jgi:DNA-binding transcriptional LysR family regulator|nr:LysR family transcriptional regulator [Rhizomicrobium sp.]
MEGPLSPRSLDWDDFRVFTAVAREGSYTRAASELRLTQSAVSRRIARLEQALGARLFDRSARGAELTGEGVRLLNHAKGAELMLARAVGSVRESVERIDGECKIIMGDGLGSYWMPPFLQSLLERNPAITLRLFTGQELANNQTPPFDVQIHYTHPMAESRVAVRVATLHFMLFASSEYVSNFGMPKALAELRHHRIADSTFRLTEKGSLASWAGLDHDAVIATNSSVVLCEAIRRGTVIGLLPTYLPVVEPKLIPVLPDMHFHAPVFVCFERETGAKPAVRATIDYLKEYVFDSRRMPWFFEHFVAPQKEWKRIYESSLMRAADHHSPHIATGS